MFYQQKREPKLKTRPQALLNVVLNGNNTATDPTEIKLQMIEQQTIKIKQSLENRK